MNFYLLSFELSGIKNIRKKIELQFYNKTLPNNLEIEGTNVKAIYGKNGSGKSGIINAVDVFQKITNRKGYLYDNKGKGYLQELINYQTNELYINFKFVLYSKTENKPYFIGNYKIVIVRDVEEDDIRIDEEVLSEVKRTSQKERIIFKSKNGKILESKFEDEINQKFTNLLEKRSVLEIIRNDLIHFMIKETPNNMDSLALAIPFIFFSVNIDVYLEDSDTHDYFLNIKHDINNIISNVSTKNKKKDIKNLQSDENSFDYHMPKYLHSKIVNKKHQIEYIDMTKKLCEFLQLFKNNLKNIDVEFRPYDTVSDYADLYFKYEQGHTVYIDFESTGIKKLINLYETLVSVDEGGIAFIDEFDANIHDVFLIKIVEYFSQYSKGQLVFTTHNLGPMEILSKKKHSLDFLSDDSQIITWTKSGNYSVVKLYRQGLLSKHHFNMMASDFIGVFSKDEKNE